MSLWDRRKAILAYLNDRRYDTVRNLAETFQVSERTIRKDIEELSCSYPIQTVRGRYGGGIYIAEWFHWQSNVLSPMQEELLRRLLLTLTGEDVIIMRSILVKFSCHIEV